MHDDEVGGHGRVLPHLADARPAPVWRAALPDRAWFRFGTRNLSFQMASTTEDFMPVLRAAMPTSAKKAWSQAASRHSTLGESDVFDGRIRLGVVSGDQLVLEGGPALVVPGRHQVRVGQRLERRLDLRGQAQVLEAVVEPPVDGQGAGQVEEVPAVARALGDSASRRRRWPPGCRPRPAGPGRASAGRARAAERAPFRIRRLRRSKGIAVRVFMKSPIERVGFVPAPGPG